MNRQGNGSEPLHAQIAARVRRYVRDGVYNPGQRLPAEVDLARTFGVSRGTLRHALRVLMNEAVIQTVPGRGTFIGDALLPRAAGLIGMILPSVVRARNPELIGGA